MGLHFDRLHVRASKIDVYLPFIRTVLEKYPNLTASRLHEMVNERGYEGGVDHFRDMVARHRPKPAAEAYLRLSTLPGEQAQVDWAYFGKVKIGNGTFVVAANISKILYGDGDGEFFPGACRRIFEVGRSAAGAFIRQSEECSFRASRRCNSFQPAIIGVSGALQVCTKAGGSRAGESKRACREAIQYIQHSFFAARQWSGLEDLNKQAMDWSQGATAGRKCAGERDGRGISGRLIEKLRWNPPTDFGEAMIPQVVPLSNCFFFIRRIETNKECNITHAVRLALDGPP
jgi:hypothetical protein